MTWDGHRHLQSYIKAAISFGKPPLAFILEEPSHTEWNKWDIRIANAYQMMLDFEVEGWPIWIDQSDRVKFDIKTRPSKSAEALERAQFEESKKQQKLGDKYKPKFGERRYAVPKTIDGGPLPTKREWIENQQRKAKGQEGLAPNEKRLTTGRVVKVAANPEEMALYRKKARERKARGG